MSQQFLTFQKFNNLESANAMADLLKENNIENEIENERNYFDISFANNKFDANINVKIASQDFNKAYQILENYYADAINNVEQDYYLFQFTDDELNEIIIKPDEWGYFDYVLAKKILVNKGQIISQQTIEEYKTKRIKEKLKTTKSPTLWILLGYTCSILYHITLFAYYLLGTAMVIGITLSFLRKTLSNGQSVYYFDKNSRNNGIAILLITITGIIFWIIFLFIKSPHR